MGLVQGQSFEVGEQYREIEGRAVECYEQIVSREFVTEPPTVQRFSSHQRGKPSVSIEADDGNVTVCIGFNVQIDRAWSQPFVQSPVLAGMQRHGKKSRILPLIVVLCVGHGLVIPQLAPPADAGDRRGRKKIRPGVDPESPEMPFSLQADAGQKAKGALNHDVPFP
jgi:hypothetical protein